MKTGFLRGYFDTDGCIRFEKINQNKQANYPKIEFSSISQNLRDDVVNLLESIGIKSYKWEILKKIGKESGAHDSYKNLLNKVNNAFKTIDDVKDVCGDCDWRENCLWYSSLEK